METRATEPMELSDGVNKVLTFARNEAFRFKSKVITPGHLFVAFILEGSVADILTQKASRLEEFRQAAQDTSWNIDENILKPEIKHNSDVKRALEIASGMASQDGSISISTLHLLRAILLDGLLRDAKQGDGMAEVILKSMIGSTPGRLLVESGAMSEEEVRRKVKAIIDSEPEGLTKETLKRQHGIYQF
ncbi:MAG: hypothetical protein HY427_02670 [Candidatus Levybacteria bacterium]|nr:hypothetical protein [Candidatus Levybacteria bacterium]